MHHHHYSASAMVFRQFAILLFAFGLLSAAASSSSESSTTAASESSTSSGTASEISTAAASESSTTAASEISASSMSTTAAVGSANEGSSNVQTSQNPATTTTTTAQDSKLAYEQTVSFKVNNISAFADSFNVEAFKNAAVNNSSTMNVTVSVAVKLAFTASYSSSTEAKTQVALTLGISEDNVEVAELTTRRLKSSTRRLSDNKTFSVTATATLETMVDVTDEVANVPGSNGVQTEVVVTVKIFAPSGTTLPTPYLRLGPAAADLTGVDASSVKLTAMTSPDDAAVTTSSNSVLPWVFTAGLVGIVALF